MMLMWMWMLLLYAFDIIAVALHYIILTNKIDILRSLFIFQECQSTY
jgi:hypothetical protein